MKSKTKKQSFPGISIVMPVYNEEDKIEACLKSIRKQDYPQDKIEIVFVDDNSTDSTLKISKKYNIKIVRNGKHDYDIGKSIGIKNSSFEYIMFLDADNILPNKDFMKQMIKPLIEDNTLIGSQPIWFTYDKSHPLADRYASLFGITDPLVIYLKKRDRLTLYEDKWNFIPGVIEKPTYFIAQFNKNNLSTVGSVGFTIKKDYLLKTNYDPTFSHLDCVMDLVNQGYNKFAFVKTDLVHLHAKTVEIFLNKLKRNMKIFLRDQQIRRYKWETSKWQLFTAVFKMSTIVVPLYHSLKGYKKIHDIAWFLHPYICLRVVFMYSWIILKSKVKKPF